MQLVVPKETRSGEKRVAAAPATIAKLIKLGFEVTVESDAGLNALFTNENYKEAGAKVTTDISSAIKNADVVASVGTLPANLSTSLKPGAVCLSFAQAKETKKISQLLPKPKRHYCLLILCQEFHVRKVLML